MRAVSRDDRHAAMLGICSGKLIPSVRNRAVGQESSVAVERPDGGLQICVETELAFNELALRQSTIASFDETLRPEWCRVDATINSRILQVTVDIGARDAIVRVWADTGDEERSIVLRGRPLLLPDNCFTLHALSAWSALHGDRTQVDDHDAAGFTPLPVGQDLRVSCQALRPVSLGGLDLGTPSMTLHLRPDLDEHVWLVDNRVERLAIPRLHVRVDRVASRKTDGETECTIR